MSRQIIRERWQRTIIKRQHARPPLFQENKSQRGKSLLLLLARIIRSTVITIDLSDRSDWLTDEAGRGNTLSASKKNGQQLVYGCCPFLPASAQKCAEDENGVGSDRKSTRLNSSHSQKS